MNALLRRGTDVLLDAHHTEPTPGPGELIVRPTLAAVAPADLAAARGEPHAINFQGVLGHRFVGVVESAADERHAALVGKRVVADPFVVDPKSDLARRGLARHAPDRALIGLKDRDGCFADRIAIPAANAAELPDAVTDDLAVFAVPLAAAVHASRIVTLEQRTFVTVLGDGLDALLCAQVMAKLNHTVRLLATRDDRLAIAERWGVRRRPLEEAGLRHDQDVVIDCTADPAMLARAFGMVRPRGTVVLKREPLPLPIARAGAHDAGDTNAPPGPDLTPVILNELQLVGASLGRVAEAVPELASDQLDLTGLITKRHKLADGVAALRSAAADDQITVVIEIN